MSVNCKFDYGKNHGASFRLPKVHTIREAFNWISTNLPATLEATHLELDVTP